MQTIEGLKRKIQSTEDLQAVVRTMKTLAAVSIRQYEQALKSLKNYDKTIETGFQIVMRNNPTLFSEKGPVAKKRLGAVIFGSDQGMCGQINEQVVAYAVETIDELGIEPESRTILAVGVRVKYLLEDIGQPVKDSIYVPSSVAGITPTVQQILMEIENWNQEIGVNQVFLFYNEQLTGASYRPRALHLLPFNQDSFHNLQKAPWPTRALPTYTMDVSALLSALIRQYLFVSLYRAFAESLASENTSRLVAMQGAEKNIGDRLVELNNQFHQKRQMSITEELLDIVAGFEALKEDRNKV